MLLKIEYQCPQCGAPAVMDETDRLFLCRYCRVKSFLLDTGGFQYVMPNNSPDDKDIIYFPYWRFKGMFFAHSQQLTHRVFDLSHQAIESEWFPRTVGLRSQALKLKFISNSIPGRFLKPALSFNKVLESFKTQFTNPLPKPLLHTEFIGESLSMIYSPFYYHEKLFDGVLNRPVSAEPIDESYLNCLPGGSPRWNVQFVPCICPNCGWDLTGESDSLILLCRNCNHLWQSGKNKLQPLPFGCITEKSDNIVYLPFWRIKVQVEGIQLQNQGDMVKIANLPKVITAEAAEQPFYFWATAFKIRPNMLLRLNRQITLIQPCKNQEPIIPAERIIKANLPINEAVESLKSTLATFIVPQNFLIKHLPQINITAKKYKLILIPFRDDHHEYIHTEVPISVQKSMLEHAKNL